MGWGSQSRLNRKMHPTLKANSETRFPHQHPLGNGIPFWTSIPGCAFRFDVRGKLRPGIPAQTGMTFPDGAGFGKRVPLWGGAHSGMDFPHGGFIWKLRPVLVTDSGIHFPVRPHRGNCAPFWGGRLGRAFPGTDLWGKHVPFRPCGPLRAPSSACSTNKKTGWNGNSSRLYL